MKKAGVLFIFLVASISFSLALSIDMKPSYSKKETIIAKISGNVLEPITSSQIQFKRNNVPLALDFGVSNIGGTFYIWAIAPSDAGNYSLNIKDVLTTIEGIQTKIDFQQNFSVLSELAPYNVRPGAIFSRENFTIEVNLFIDTDTSIIKQYFSQEEITLKPGKNLLYFSINEIFNSKLLNISIGDYSIPAYLVGASNNEPEAQLGIFSFVPEKVSKSFPKDSNPTFTIIIKNNQNFSVSNIQSIYNSSIFSSSSEKFSLASGEEKTLSFALIGPLTSDISEYLIIKSENSTFKIPVSIKLISNLSKVNITSETKTESLYCFQFDGFICNSDETCIGEIRSSLDGNCCIGSCQKKKSSSSNWVIYVLVLAVLTVVGYILYKFKKSPKISTSKPASLEAMP